MTTQDNGLIQLFSHQVAIISYNVVLFCISCYGLAVAATLLWFFVAAGAISLILNLVFVGCTIAGAFGAVKKHERLVQVNFYFFAAYAVLQIALAIWYFVIFAGGAGAVSVIFGLLAAAASYFTREFWLSLTTLPKDAPQDKPTEQSPPYQMNNMQPTAPQPVQPVAAPYAPYAPQPVAYGSPSPVAYGQQQQVPY